MEHMSVMTNAIERGDVIIAKSPTNPRHTVCKRVGGVAAEHFF
jgi:inner membrane protease subunit 1